MEQVGINVLVVGGGGREHALAQKLVRSLLVKHVYVAPGNAGTERGDKKIYNLGLVDNESLSNFARAMQIVLTVVGPEVPLATGIVNLFQERKLPIFGPTQMATQLESSKRFAKEFMMRYGIPTALGEWFSTPALAHDHVMVREAPMVVKADGLQAGKGVDVCLTYAEAHMAIERIAKMLKPDEGIIIEDCLEGEEVSFIVMVDSHGNVKPLASAQDHKRLLNGDQGPNTGGMGAYSPAPIVSPVLHERIMHEIILPTVSAMADAGIPYSGFLYAGLMIDRYGNPKVLEFNCRLGDPETQPILMRLKSDLVDLLLHAVNGTLDQAVVEWDDRPAVSVVLAADGYPCKPETGDVITLPSKLPSDVEVFHAGTTFNEQGQLVVSGGRVLCVTALGQTYREAKRRAYHVVEQVDFKGMQFRTDIGLNAIARDG